MKHSMTIMRAMIPACVWLRGEVQPAAAQHIITEIIGAGLRTPNGLNGSEGIAGILDDGLRLMPHSSAIDVGDNASLLDDTWNADRGGDTAEKTPLDLDDTARIKGGTVDIGAYEAR